MYMYFEVDNFIITYSVDIFMLQSGTREEKIFQKGRGKGYMSYFSFNKEEGQKHMGIKALTFFLAPKCSFDPSNFGT